MPRSGATDSTTDTEVGPAGVLRAGLTVLRGFTYDGGHPETKGLSPTGQVITVPRHEHQVSLDLTRIETSIAYSFPSLWEVQIRIPYDIKEQRTSVRFSSPMTVAEIDAALRNGSIHHRDATYDGLADFHLLGAYRWLGAWVDGDSLHNQRRISIRKRRRVALRRCSNTKPRCSVARRNATITSG